MKKKNVKQNVEDMEEKQNNFEERVRTLIWG